jgi:hypothetical protein
MPAATPVPRGPTVLTLYTAADLLTGPGCPVCRYADEAADRYLAWFALEGHADAMTVTRLCASLGMCPRHTRGLINQPGADRRLTALYRYLTEAASDRLAAADHRAARPDGCPACKHDDGAAGRALETLLDCLADGQVRDRYRELGGLCIPHLRAASARGDHQVLSWLARTMTGAVTGRAAGPGWLAVTGRDADARIALRTALPAAALPGSGACAACLAAGRSEAGHLARMADGSDRGRPDRRLLLCPGHLGDLIVLAGQPAAPRLLAWQADCLAAALIRPASSPGRRPGGPARWLRTRRRPRAGPAADDCPVCLASGAAAQRAVDDLRGRLRAEHPLPGRQAALCVRHLLGLKVADPYAGQLTAPGAIERAHLLIAELDEAFSKGTWTHRHEAKGPEMTAWRRAAAFLDGGVFCGRPPIRT